MSRVVVKPYSTGTGPVGMPPKILDRQELLNAGVATRGRVRRRASCERAKKVIRYGQLPEHRRAADFRTRVLAVARRQDRVRRFTSRRRQIMLTEEVIDLVRVDVLKSLARKAGLPGSLTRKGELTTALADYLHSNPRDFLAHLTDQERMFLAEAAHNGGYVAPEVYQARYNVRCPRPGRFLDAKRASLINLVISEDHFDNQLCIPRTLAEALRPLLPKPSPAGVETVEEVPADHSVEHWGKLLSRPVHVFEGSRHAFGELGRVLNLVQAGKVRIQAKSRRPTGGAERLLAGALTEPDFDLEPPPEERDEYTSLAGPIRAHAWGVLVQQSGWCKPHGEKLTLTKAGKELLGGVQAAAFRAGVDRFIDDDRFDEFNRINHVRGQTGKGKRGMTDPAQRREAIRESMCEWPPGRWIRFEDAFRFIYASGNSFILTESPWYLYFGESQYGHLSSNGDGLERQYARAFFFESAATLGLIDVAYAYPHGLWPEFSGAWGTDDLGFCGRYDGLLYVRLNPLGAYCLGVADDYEPPPVEQRDVLHVLPNRELAITDASQLSPSDRSMLDLFAKPKGDHLWRLDSGRILTHLENGGSIDDILRFIESNTARGMPHPVEVFFKELQGKAGAVASVADALLIEIKDRATAALVAHDPRAGKLCLLAGERHLVVRKKNERAFRTAVKKLGYVMPQ